MDIKPPNFILVAGQMKIIDFGCAEEISSEKTSVLCKLSKGTEGYMASECSTPVKGKYFEYSFGTDSFALGVVLIFLLSKVDELQHHNMNLSKYFDTIISNTMQENQFRRKTPREILEGLRE